MKYNPKLPYLKSDTTVNLLTNEISQENKVYLVDKRLVDFLLQKVSIASLNDIKDDITNEIAKAQTKDDLFERLDNYIYLNKIYDLVSERDIIDNNNIAKSSEGINCNY